MGVLDYNKNIQSDNNKGSEEILTASPNITKVDDKALTPSTILGSQIAKTSYGLTHLNYKGNKYNEYGVNINPINTEEELNLERAKNQSGFEQIGNSLAQIVENEILLGIPLGFSNIIDWTINKFKEESNDFTNPVSKYLEDLQEENKKRLEIYQKNPDKSWQIGDLGWWTNNFVSVGSTVALMAPSAATAKGVSWLNKVTRLNKLEANILKNIANVGNRIEKGKKLLFNPYKWTINTNNFLENATAAFVSRVGEGYMEARDTYNVVYDKALKELNEMNSEKYNEFISRNPNYENLSKEEIAKDLASISGTNTFKEDFPLILLDFLQYKSINNTFKNSIKKPKSTAQARLEHKNTLRKLAGEAEEEITTKALIKENLRHGFKNPFNTIDLDILTEGFEEGWQGIVQQRSEELYKMSLDPNISPRSLSSYLKDGHIWEQAFWGIIGGAVFQGVGSAANNIIDEIDRVKNNKRLTDKNKKERITNAKIQSADINSRFTKMKDFVEKMQALNNGHHYEEYAVDEKGKPIEDSEGAFMYKKLTDVEILQEKEKLINEFVDELVLQSVDNGTYELTKEFVESPYFNKYFAQQGLQQSDIDLYIKDRVQNRIESTYQQYINNLDMFMSVIDNPYPHSLQAAARDLTSRQIAIEQYTDILNSIDEKLTNLNSLERLDDGSYDRALLNAIHTNIRYLDKQVNKYEQQYHEGKISKQALNEYKKQIEQYKNNIYRAFKNLRSNNETLNDIKKSIDNIIKNADINSANADFYQIVGKLTDILYAGTPDILTDTVRDLLEERAVNDIKRELDIINLPVGEDGIREMYKDLDYSITQYAFDKIDKAFKLVEDYVMNAEDPNVAVNELMTNSENLSKEMKDALEILKLGHVSTNSYMKGLEDVKKRALRKQAKEEEKAKEVVVDGNTLSEEEADKTKSEVTELIDKSDDSSTGEDKQAVDFVEQAAQSYAEQEEAERQGGLFMDKYFDGDDFGFRESFNDLILGSVNKKQYIEIIKNIKVADFSDPNFKLIFNTLVDNLLKEYSISEQDANRVVLTEIKNVLHAISIASSTNPSLRQKYSILAKQIEYGFKLKANKESLYITSTINNIDAELELIDEFIKVYQEDTNTKDRALDIDTFFEQILTNDEVNYKTASVIFRYFNDYVRKYNIPIINDSNFRKFSENSLDYFKALKEIKAQREVISDYMHIVPANIKSDLYETALNKALAGEPVVITKSNIGADQLSIGIFVNGKYVELGFITKTKITNSTNTKIKKSFNAAGLWWEIDKDDRGYTSNYDEFFNELMAGETDAAKELLNVLNKIGDSVRLNKESKEYLMNLISKIKGGQEILNEYHRQSNMKTNKGKETFGRIIKDIKNVALYKTQDSAQMSYQNWLEKVYDNYIQTRQIADAVESAKEGTRIVATLKNIGIQRPNYLKNTIDVSTQPFIAEKNVVFAVDKEGNIITETGNHKFNDGTIFSAGTMGFLINNANGNPFIARFVESNTLNSNTKLGKLVEKYLTKLFTEYQTNENYTIDHLYEDLLELLVLRKSKNDTNYNPLFSGYTIIKINGGIAIAKAPKYGTKTDKLQFVAAIYDKKYTSKEFEGEAGQTRAITLFNEEGKPYRNEINGQQVSFSTYNPEYISFVVDDIIKGLEFNRSLLFVVNRNVKDVKTNKHFYKENGKLYIDFDGERIEYNSYFQFIMDNNAFKTNVEAINGEFTSDVSDKNALYIGVTRVEAAKDEYEENHPTANIDEAINLITNSTSKKPANVNLILDNLGLDSHPIKKIIGTIISDEIYYDSHQNRKGHGSYSNGKVYIRHKGLDLIRKNPYEFVRLLAHENLHMRFEEVSLFERDYLNKELLETYNQFIEAVESRVQEGDKQAIRLKNWIEENNFKPNRQFIKDDVNNRKFIEEWLVESITRPEIANFLNSVNYKGEIVKGKEKSILEKILEAILNFLGFSFDNFNEISILAKQLSLVSDSYLNNINPVEVTENNEFNVQSPVEETVNPQQEETEEETEEEDDEEDEDYESFDDYLSDTSSMEVIEENPNYIEDALNRFYDNANNNPQGYIMIEDMEKFIQSFPLNIRPKIRQMIDENRLKFICR